MGEQKVEVVGTESVPDAAVEDDEDDKERVFDLPDLDDSPAPVSRKSLKMINYALISILQMVLAYFLFNLDQKQGMKKLTKKGTDADRGEEIPVIIKEEADAERGEEMPVIIKEKDEGV